jgi:hypothetical protein
MGDDIVAVRAELGLDLLNRRLDDLFRLVNRMASVEYVTPRLMRVPIGLRADQPYAVVGGPARGRQWHIRRVSINANPAFYPIMLYSDESLSASSMLWIFEAEPCQETWSREEMVLQPGDTLVISAGVTGAHFGGHVQVVDMPAYGIGNEPSEA